MSTQPPIWALLVSVEEYGQKHWPPAAGAHVDSNNVYTYLTQDLNTPTSNIRRLHGENATRARIISEFKEHLIDNSSIERGDAILFYFSGHGSYLKAPPGWTISREETKDETDEDMVEVILPYDEGSMSAQGSPICSIPDRTLAALIDAAARAHGNNITIVLDCCSSGHGTRGNDSLFLDGEELVPRNIASSQLAELVPERDNLVSFQVNPDASLVVSPFSSLPERKGSFRAVPPTHVLLAACKPREFAMGAKDSGGILTRLWLMAMERLPLCTYTEVIKFINKYIQLAQKRDSVFLGQHPQCEGVIRDRLVFQETMIKSNHFVATQVTSVCDGRQLSLDAGEVHGVSSDTTFAIYTMDEYLQGQVVGTATVSTISANSCTVNVTWTSPQCALHYTAAITSRHKLHVMLHCQDTPLGRAESPFTRIKASLHGHASFVEVQSEAMADLIICVDAGGSVELKRLDSLMWNLPNPNPLLTVDETNAVSFHNVLHGISRFNWLLPLTNPLRPFANKVEVALFRIDDTDHDTPVLKRIESSSDCLEVTNVDRYAMILRNDTPVDLYIQAWYFDPDEYSIQRLYEPPNNANPTLPAYGGELRIGTGIEGPPLEYYLPDGCERATMFVKVYLTTEPSRLGMLTQNAVIGPSADLKRGSEYKLVETLVGHWDTIVQPITVVRRGT